MRRKAEQFYQKVVEYKKANPDISLRKIGRHFDISHERVRQIIKEHGNGSKGK